MSYLSFQVSYLNSTDLSTTLKAAHLPSFTQTTDLLNFEAKNYGIFLIQQISEFCLCKQKATLRFTYSILILT